MNLLEHEAKRLLAAAGIPIPRGQLITDDSSDTPDFPLVLKSQVPVGGRGKAGGIKLIESADAFETTRQALLNLSIKGYSPTSLLAEEKLSIARELYLSLLVDRATASIQLVAHTDGGMEVEDNTDFQKWTISLEHNDIDALGQSLADYYDLPGQTFALQDIVEHLIACLKTNDATLIEINPLILTDDNRLIAGDAKITLDDAAAFRHDWKFTDTPTEANFVTIDQNGTTATIANGAGLAMATVDAAVSAGLSPANFLDVGGGASKETLLTAFHRIIEYPNVRAIVINIFAGITRSDEVARAIIAAKQEINELPPLFIRLAGTNYDEAVTLLTDAGITIMPSLEACLGAAKESLDV